MSESAEPKYVAKVKAFVEANKKLSPEVGPPPETDYSKMTPAGAKSLMLAVVEMWSSTVAVSQIRKETKERIREAEKMLCAACEAYLAACEAVEEVEK